MAGWVMATGLPLSRADILAINEILDAKEEAQADLARPK